MDSPAPLPKDQILAAMNRIAAAWDKDEGAPEEGAATEAANA